MDQHDKPAQQKRLRLTKETLRFFAADGSEAAGTNSFSGECFTQCTMQNDTCQQQATCMTLGSCNSCHFWC